LIGANGSGRSDASFECARIDQPVRAGRCEPARPDTSVERRGGAVQRFLVNDAESAGVFEAHQMRLALVPIRIADPQALRASRQRALDLPHTGMPCGARRIDHVRAARSRASVRVNIIIPWRSIMANSLIRRDPRMNPISRIFGADPFREFDDFFSSMRMPSLLSSADMAPQVRMDVTETDQAYQVMADLPGIKKDDIKVNIEGNQVSISAQTESRSEQQSATSLCSERSWGQYYRSFTLPQAVDDAQAQAQFHDGVLELTLPKKAGGTAKPLAIQ
jgi:HSP20 family protein